MAKVKTQKFQKTSHYLQYNGTSLKYVIFDVKKTSKHFHVTLIFSSFIFK
jgi:5-hydroxyisourate hydrolase-like protein (transthyretin family)